MKKTIISITLIFSINVFAQTSLTNLVPIFVIKQEPLYASMGNNIQWFKQKINSEDATLQKRTPTNLIDINLQDLTETITSNMTNHVWRYESTTDTVYIHPETNAISMTFFNSIAVTNTAVDMLFSMDGELGINKLGIRFETGIFIGDYKWSEKEISFELENVFLWEILDEICAQLDDRKRWHLVKSEPGKIFKYAIFFY